MGGKNAPYGEIDTRQPTSYDKGKEGSGDEMIFSAEKRLGVKLPEAYRWFLLIKRYSLDHMGYPVK